MLCQIKERSDGDLVLDFLTKLISVILDVWLFFLDLHFKICIRFSSLRFKAKPKPFIFYIYEG